MRLRVHGPTRGRSVVSEMKHMLQTSSRSDVLTESIDNSSSEFCSNVILRRLA